MLTSASAAIGRPLPCYNCSSMKNITAQFHSVASNTCADYLCCAVPGLFKVCGKRGMVPVIVIFLHPPPPASPIPLPWSHTSMNGSCGAVSCALSQRLLSQPCQGMLQARHSHAYGRWHAAACCAVSHWINRSSGSDRMHDPMHTCSVRAQGWNL